GEKGPDEGEKNERMVKTERNTKNASHDDGCHQALAHAANGLRIAQAQRDAVDESADAECDDQRIEAEIDEKKAVQEADQLADCERGENGAGDGHPKTQVDKR